MDFVSAKHGNTNPFSVVLFQVNPIKCWGHSGHLLQMLLCWRLSELGDGGTSRGPSSPVKPSSAPHRLTHIGHVGLRERVQLP